MILRKKSPKEVEDTNQRIKRFFKDPGLRAKIEVSITVDNFLDESMNLDTRLYRPWDARQTDVDLFLPSADK